MPKFFEESVVDDHFDDFRIVEHIDSGGFKDVFLAEHDGKEIVLKLLPIERRSRRKRANREGEAMQKIESDIFVDLVDYFEEDINGKRTFVILEEYIAGSTLADAIEEGRSGVEFGYKVIDTITNILLEFDKKNIIHRDIKPENIMVDEDNQIRVLDVGIVRFEEKESLTPDHMDRLGTPRYGAPEQLVYNKEKQTIKTDLFSSGIVMFESITGEHPFDIGGTSVTDAICEGKKRNLEGFIGETELGQEFNFVFDTLTKTAPHKRYRKPEYAREDLKTIGEMI